ncbi:MAG: protease HtpX [Deltaproteobacteria bacterium RIFCSPHIGHO2_12_FULL_43_9]|nr:MAG: protease HtpX [Deltaproteobacteria bacterium RIFCSPHIGHO2_12_FULL_43_9]
MKNQIKTTFLLALLTVLLVLIGGAIGGRNGATIFFFIALAINFVSYWFSDKIVLKLYRAQPLPIHDPIVESVRRLSQRGQLPMPRVYEIPTDAPNAFATGRNPSHAAVAVTSGIRRLLNQDELEGVLAHELAHIKNRDTLISCIAASIAGAIMLLANMSRWALIFGNRDSRGGGAHPAAIILMSIIAPLAAMIVQMAISRSREFFADETGASIAGTPRGLATALQKIDAFARRIPLTAEPSPATAHLFIINPFQGRNLLSLFSTHPPVEERIRRLLGRRV